MIKLEPTSAHRDYYQGIIKTSAFFTFDKNPMTLGIYTCREGFAGVFTRDTKMVGYIATNGYSGMENLLKFWREVEDRLGLASATIHETNFDKVVVIEVDPFWTLNSTRRGFFTMLFRLACVFSKGQSFEKTLDNYTYTIDCRAAVLHFLSGHTTPTYEEKDLGIGVVSKFKMKQPNEVETMLVKLIMVK